MEADQYLARWYGLYFLWWLRRPRLWVLIGASVVGVLVSASVANPCVTTSVTC